MSLSKVPSSNNASFKVYNILTFYLTAAGFNRLKKEADYRHFFPLPSRVFYYLTEKEKVKFNSLPNDKIVD